MIIKVLCLITLCLFVLTLVSSLSYFYKEVVKKEDSSYKNCKEGRQTNTSKNLPRLNIGDMEDLK